MTEYYGNPADLDLSQDTPKSKIPGVKYICLIFFIQVIIASYLYSYITYFLWFVADDRFIFNEGLWVIVAFVAVFHFFNPTAKKLCSLSRENKIQLNRNTVCLSIIILGLSTFAISFIKKDIWSLNILLFATVGGLCTNIATTALKESTTKIFVDTHFDLYHVISQNAKAVSLIATPVGTAFLTSWKGPYVAYFLTGALPLIIIPVIFLAKFHRYRRVIGKPKPFELGRPAISAARKAARQPSVDENVLAPVSQQEQLAIQFEGIAAASGETTSPRPSSLRHRRIAQLQCISDEDEPTINSQQSDLPKDEIKVSPSMPREETAAAPQARILAEFKCSSDEEDATINSQQSNLLKEEIPAMQSREDTEASSPELLEDKQGTACRAPWFASNIRQQCTFSSTSEDSGKPVIKGVCAEVHTTPQGDPLPLMADLQAKASKIIMHQSNRLSTENIITDETMRTVREPSATPSHYEPKRVDFELEEQSCCMGCLKAIVALLKVVVGYTDIKLMRIFRGLRNPALKNFILIPLVISKSILSIIPLIIFVMTPYRGRKELHTAEPFKTEFHSCVAMVFWCGLAWVLLLCGGLAYILACARSKIMPVILFIIGLEACNACLALWALGLAREYIITTSSLFGAGHGLIKFTEDSVYRNAFGPYWSQVQSFIDYSTGLLVLTFYAILDFCFAYFELKYLFIFEVAAYCYIVLFFMWILALVMNHVFSKS